MIGICRILATGNDLLHPNGKACAYCKGDTNEAQSTTCPSIAANRGATSQPNTIKDMDKPIEIPFAQAKRIIQTVYPGEKGSRRTVKVEMMNDYHVRDYWDGGTRHAARFVGLAPIKELSKDDVLVVPNSATLVQDYHVLLETSYMVVEHTIFQGKEAGYRIILHPSHTSDWHYFIKEVK